MDPDKAQKAMKKGEAKMETVATTNEKYCGWDLMAWEWSGTWRVTAELFDRENLRYGITWGGWDKSTKEEALQDARDKIDSGKFKITQYERTGPNTIRRVG